MIDTHLHLPDLEPTLRRRGLTMVIDPGLFTGQFEDAIDSVGEFVDLVKFGWGTCLVTKDIKRKIDILRSAGIGFYFGGTLFERYALDGLVSEWLALCRVLGTTHVEVSNGTIPVDALAPVRWISFIKEDLAAGAYLVTAEARESGRSGICRSDGEPRHELVDEMADDVIALETLRRGLRSDTLLGAL
jgi:phosphosulfolactate synthase